MTHPDIKYIERYGYTRGELERGRRSVYACFAAVRFFRAMRGSSRALTVCFVILNAAITTMKLIHRSKCE